MSEVISDNFSLEKAIEIAKTAHAGRVDKAGQPYINHPLAVMSQLEGEDARCVAVLHDVIEDSKLGFDDLERMAAPKKVIDALRLITHPADYRGTEEEYIQWIETLARSGNQLAIDVKWADLTHNSDISRIPSPSDRDRRRVEKYKMSKQILLPFVSAYLIKLDNK